MEPCMKYAHLMPHFCKHLGLFLEKCAEEGGVCTRVPRRDEQNVVFTHRFTQVRVGVRWSRRLWVGWIQSSSSTLRAFSTASSGRKNRLGTLEENSASQNFWLRAQISCEPHHASHSSIQSQVSMTDSSPSALSRRRRLIMPTITTLAGINA